MRNYRSFNVAGTHYTNKGMKISRMEWIRKYIGPGATFVLEREPTNEHDKNAIRIYHVLKKTGKKIMIGYVPNSHNVKLADEWAPLIDMGWDPEIKFLVRLIVEKDNPKKGTKAGDCVGLKLRYPIR